MSRIVVLTPVYRRFPWDGVEENGLNSITGHLRDLPKVAIGPSIYTRELEAFGFQHLDTPDVYWGHPDSRAYSPLLCSRGLYRELADAGHDWVLVHHLDAVTLRPGSELYPFTHGTWDVIGAPCWGTAKAMNGGYSLRRLPALLAALHGRRDWLNIDRWHADIGMNEDIWWSTASGVRVPPRMIAVRFAWETEPETCWRLNDRRLPMGVHRGHVHDPEFWRRLGGVRGVGGLIGRLDYHQQVLPPAPVSQPAELIDDEDAYVGHEQ